MARKKKDNQSEEAEQDIQLTQEDRITALKKRLKDLKIPTGSVVVGDLEALGYERFYSPFRALNTITGGFPRGKFTCISGPPQTCKTTLCLHVVAYNQRINPDFKAAFVDIENSFDPDWATHLGVDVSRLVMIRRMSSLEDYLNALNAVVDARMADMAIVDCIGAAAPMSELQTKSGDARDLRDDTIGLQPRKYNLYMRTATSRVAVNDCAVILIAQVYSDIGNPYGGFKVTGGLGLHHRTHLRLMLRRTRDDTQRIETMADGKQRKIDIGYDVHIKIDKTKQNDREGAEITLPFRRGIGIAVGEAAVIAAISLGIITQKGPYYEWNGEKFLGRTAVIAKFQSVPDAQENMKKLEMQLDEESSKMSLEGGEAEVGTTEETPPSEGTDLVQESSDASNSRVQAD